MHAITWKYRENKQLDELFNELRQRQYANHSDRLWKNYDESILSLSTALSIVFDDNDVPLICSTIAHKSIWPDGVYRIFNRTWKPQYRKESLHRGVSPEMALIGYSQINWLHANTECKLYFFSRETDNWRKWAINSFSKDFNIFFTDGEYDFLTCENTSSDTCWQTIIYNGDFDVLKNWPHK